MAGRRKPIFILYYLLHGLGLIISILGLASAKIIAISLAGAVVLYLGSSALRVIASIIIFWSAWALLFPSLGKYIAGKGLLLVEYSKRFKKSYIAIYGSDFKCPEFDDFNLEPEEYFSYNRRFTIDSEFIPFLFIPFTLILLLNITTKRGLGVMVVCLLIAFSIYFLVKYIIIRINNLLSKKYSQHEKVLAYAKALNIYKIIQEELKDDADSFEGWED